MSTDCKPLKISWSRLRVHDECPAKGDLRSRGLKSPLLDTTNFFKGNVTDQLMRRWLSMENPELGWMAAQVDAVFDEMEANPEGVLKWKHANHRAETRAFCRELVVRLEELLVTFCLPFDWTPAWRFEVPVKVQYAGTVREILLVGEIDLIVFDREGGIVVLDLKATKDNQYYRKVLGQLTFYNLAVKLSRAPRLGQWPSKSGLIQPMCDQRMLPVTVTPDAIREMAGRIERVARDIWEGRMPPKPGEFCGSCECRQACPIFSAPVGGRALLTA
jgi:PD-(D/E)XK nuclease superfamily